MSVSISTIKDLPTLCASFRVMERRHTYSEDPVPHQSVNIAGATGKVWLDEDQREEYVTNLVRFLKRRGRQTKVVEREYVTFVYIKSPYNDNWRVFETVVDC